MFSPEEIQKFANVLMNCTSDQLILIEKLDALVIDEDSKETTDTIKKLKNSLIESWKEIQINKELLSALPVLTFVKKKYPRKFIGGSSVLPCKKFHEVGVYEFYLIENKVTKKRRIHNQLLVDRNVQIMKRLENIPLCFSEYAAFLTESHISSDSEYLTTIAMLEEQWAVKT